MTDKTDYSAFAKLGKKLQAAPIPQHNRTVRFKEVALTNSGVNNGDPLKVTSVG